MGGACRCSCPQGLIPGGVRPAPAPPAPGLGDPQGDLGRAYLQGGSQEILAVVIRVYPQGGSQALEGEGGREVPERFRNDFRWFLMVLVSF